MGRMSGVASVGTSAVSEGPVLVESSGGVQVVTINRPESRNAINTAAAAAIGAAMEELDACDDLVAGVITGAGSGFCAGMDLKAFLAGERPSVEGRGFAGLVEKPPEKPLIAAVEGAAVGGGFEIALACDLVVAAEGATFGLPEVKRGLIAAGGGVLRLPERVPYHLAMEWVLSGELVSAQCAYEVGLLNGVTEDGQAREVALELACKIAANGPLAVRASKYLLKASRDWTADEAFAKQGPVVEPVRSSEDAGEGARAFREKRAPVWRAR